MKVTNKELNKFFETFSIKQVIREVTTSTGAEPDDGPVRLDANKAQYTTRVHKLARLIGYKVLNHVVNDIQFSTLEDYPEYSNDVVKGSSFYDSDNGEEIWKRYIKNVAEVVGYKFLEYKSKVK